MKNKFLTIICSLSSLSFLLAGCGEKESEHKHIPLLDIEYNETEHYHKCITCGEKLEVEPHTLQNNVRASCLVEKATSTKGATYYKSCSKCGYVSNETFTLGENETMSIYTFDDIMTSFLPDMDESTKKTAKMLATALISSNISPETTKVTFRRYTFTYLSKDFENKDITLSGSISMPFIDETPFVKAIDIDHHPTFSDGSEAPSRTFTIFSALVAAGYAVIECDLIGYGVTQSLPSAYHCRHSVGRTTADGVMAALDILKNKFNVETDNKTFYNTGYSQGGYDAMAFLRYMEQEASVQEKAKIKIAKTFAGSGAYSIKIMIEESLANLNFCAPQFLMMGIITAYYAHTNLFGKYELKDFFTEYGNKFIEPIISKNGSKLNEVLNEKENNKKKYQNLLSVFSAEFMTAKNDLKDIIDQVYEIEDLIDGKWLPSSEVYLYYTPNDEMVSPKCSYKAKEVFKNLSNVHFHEGTAEDHSVGGLEFYLFIAQTLGVM